MLKTTPSNLYNEIQAAERFRNKYLEYYDDILKKYAGAAMGSQDGEMLTENHIYEYLSLTIPRLIHDNPRVSVSTRRPVTQNETAKALQHGLNRWVRDTNVRQILMRTAYDILIAYGVVLTTQQPMQGHDPGASNRPYFPACYRISPKRFICDPLALSISEARFTGHAWIRDKDDLIKEARGDSSWNKEVIETLIVDTLDKDSTGRKDDAVKDAPSRREVAGYDIWVPEVRLDESPGPEEGFNGTIYTIGLGQDGSGKDSGEVDFIRDPRPYYGPPSGPYSFFGTYYVPDKIFPLSPILATMSQVDELNDHVKSAARSATQYKRLILVDSKSKKLMQDVKSQPDNYVVPVEGLDRDRVIPIELGGITNQQVSYIQMARERLDRNSGIHDAMRGNVTGNATATEVSIADESGTVRLAYIKQQFQQSVRNLLQNVGWFLYYDERVMFPLGADAAKDLGMEEPYYVGGVTEEETGTSYNDLELEIDAYSMERTSESLRQRRTMEAFQLISNVAQAMPQMPYVKWGDLLDKLGDAMNMPDLSEMIDEQMMQEMVQQQQEQQQQMMQAELQSKSEAMAAQSQKSLPESNQ